MPGEFGDIIPVPGTSGVSEVKPADILASYARFTQKGVTLVAGSGVIAAGTLLGRITASKKYKAYANGNSDGSETAVGVLRQSVNVADGDSMGNIVVSGILFEDKLIGDDANSDTDLNGRHDLANNLFIF